MARRHDLGFGGSEIQTRGATKITGNNGGGVLVIGNSTVEFRLRSVLRFRENTAIANNAQDGVVLNTGSVVQLDDNASVTGNALPGLRCNGQAFYAGTVNGVHDNTGGGNNDGTNCPGLTRF